MSDKRAIAYRPDIDGLRAVAVLAVVAFHASPGLLSGGFVGVDVFFVISGFLISSIILRELDAGTFSLAGFYARRIRRLFPALVVVLAATLALGWYFLLPHEFRALGKHVAAGAAYFINFTLKREAGYFDAAAEEKPLLHLWSLAVEEQFYIVWPLLLLALRDRRWLIAAVALITGASFAANLEAVGRNAASAFYLPQNRVWELSAGALLAILSLGVADARLAGRLRRTGLSPAALAHVASCAGLALILGAAFGYDRSLIYPGAWAAAPVLGAVLLIAAGPGAIVNRLILARKPLVAVGLISYSLYLWHGPLLSFRSILKAGDDPLATATAVAAAFALATATYLWVERPFRRAKPVAVPAALMGATLSFCALGLLAHASLVGPRLDGLRHRAIGDAVADWRFPDGLTRVRTASGLSLFQKGTGDAGDKVLYFGDSNMQQYWPRIERLLERSGDQRAVVFATTGGCPPVPGIREAAHPNCNGFAEAVVQLARAPEYRTVVIGASWISYFNNSPYYLEGDGGGPLTVGTPAWERSFDILEGVMRDLANQGKTVWLVLNMPSSPSLMPLLALRRSLAGGTSFVPLALDRAAFERTWSPIRARLVAAAQAAGAGIIDPLPLLCDATQCPGQSADGVPLYMDGGHLRASWVREHATFLDATLGLETSSTR